MRVTTLSYLKVILLPFDTTPFEIKLKIIFNSNKLFSVTEKVSNKIIKIYPRCRTFSIENLPLSLMASRKVK